MSRRDTALKYFDENQYFMKTVVEPGIEKYRKGEASLKIVNSDGTPVSNATVKVNQKKHEFKYGANIFMLDELETKEKNDIYKESFKELFNLATIPFYWSDLEPEQGKPRYDADSPKIYRRPATDLCVNYCLENDIEPKCHCLNYDNFNPIWLKDADVDYHKKMLDKRFKEIADRYADIIPSFEVTNETLDPQTHAGKTAFYKQNDFVEWSFRRADRYFPNNKLIINDYRVWAPSDYRENRSPYFMQIERLGYEGITHLDSIGMQFHSFFKQDAEAKMAESRYNPIYLYGVLDKYAELGKKIQITEMTIPAYSNSQEDEDVQAELIEQLYTVFFGHPAMEAIIYWNMIDGYAAFAPKGDMTTGENVYRGGFLNFDLSKKKSFDVVKNLFSKKWHTKECVTTDNDGKADFRGFYGEYELEITVNGKTFTKQLNLSSQRNNINCIKLDD